MLERGAVRRGLERKELSLLSSPLARLHCPECLSWSCDLHGRCSLDQWDTSFIIVGQGLFRKEPLCAIPAPTL